jgi:hypothetical protein
VCTDDEPFYSGANEVAYQKFVMGFGPVAVPEGCEVAEVKLALQARDYYQVRLLYCYSAGCGTIVLQLCCRGISCSVGYVAFLVRAELESLQMFFPGGMLTALLRLCVCLSQQMLARGCRPARECASAVCCVTFYVLGAVWLLQTPRALLACARLRLTQQMLACGGSPALE